MLFELGEWGRNDNCQGLIFGLKFAEGKKPMSDLIKLDLVDLASAVGLMAIAIGLSAWEKLGLELNLALATGRTILQLLVLGYIFDFIFAVDNPGAVLGILAVMLLRG